MTSDDMTPYQQAIKEWRQLALDLAKKTNDLKAKASQALLAIDVAVADGRIHPDVAYTIRIALEGSNV